MLGPNFDGMVAGEIGRDVDAFRRRAQSYVKRLLQFEM